MWLQNNFNFFHHNQKNRTRWISILFLSALLFAQTGFAANFIVNQSGSQGDADSSAPGGDDNVCDIDLVAGGLQCTLRAAIQEANDQAATATTPHNITFLNSLNTITATNGLDALTAPTNINGANGNAASGNRVEYNANNTGCFNIGETNTGINVTGARGSTVRNMVIRNCQGDAISLSGHGYTITGNRIGTNAAGSASNINNDANDGHAISLSGTINPPAIPPNITSVINNPAQNIGAIAAFVTSLQGALTVVANPTFISSNLISGNKGDGINMFTRFTTNVQINANIIGLDQAGLVALPNGRGAGGGRGIRISGGGWGNVIGPGNIVSGQNEDSSDGGVDISGDVILPNFVMGNLIGLGSAPGTDVGNGDVGLLINTKPDTDGTAPDNPSGFSLFVGPANTVSDNRSDNGGGSLDAVGGDNSGGIVITGNSAGISVFGNVVGTGTFPAGGTPLGALEYGNNGNGIVVSSGFDGPSKIKIGGSEIFEANLILANKRHGILVRGSALNDVTIQGNFIGVSDPTGLGIFSFGNTGDGIRIEDASSVKVGGTGDLEDNVIAANGRHGIKVFDNGSENDSGWSNLFQRNQIYANNQNVADGIAALGIDLDRNPNDIDPVDDTPDPDPNDSYGNFAQNAPIICTGAGLPVAICTSGPAYNSGSGATSSQWTIKTRPNGNYRIEFFQLTPTGMQFLNEQLITTDASGLPNSGGCVAGLCSSSVTPATATNTSGTEIVMTATDLFLADVPPLGNQPVPLPLSASNNTSEFSNTAGVPEPGELRFSIGAYSANEADPTATITVQRVNGADGEVSVTFATSNGSAVAPSDYASNSNTLTWADGDVADKTFTVSIVDDGNDENNETVNLTLSAPTNNAVLGTPNTAVLTIQDNDNAPTIAINDIAQLEGNVGTSAFTFEVTLSSASGLTVTVSAASSNGTATLANNDYVQLNASTITFNPGETSKPITVNVNGDAADEGDENFNLNLTTPSNASISDNIGVGTIQNDDAVGAQLSINDVNIAEGNIGTSILNFTITRTQTAGTASVDVVSNNGSASTLDNDFVALPSTTINFADGIATQTVAITMNGDTKFEPNENFTLTLSNPVSATILDGTGTGTINNDDLQPSISINDLSVAEGNAGTTPFNFNIVLSNASSQTITVSAASSNGSATLANNDYVQLNASVITFNPGVTSMPVLVNANGDTNVEANENFNVDLSAPSNATMSDAQGVGTIQNDDAAGAQLSVNDVNMTEGNAGTSLLNFTVTRSITTGTASVDVASSNGTATIANNDYLALPTTTLNFADGVATLPVSVTINGDLVFESNENFNLNLSNPVNASILDGIGVGTINNDDAQPTISINDLAQLETDAGTTAFSFTVSLSGASSQSISVSAASSDGSATLVDNDYVQLNATVLTFVPGDVSESVVVNVNGDATDEPTETLTVNLSGASNATILDSQGIATIQNDDAAGGEFNIDDVSINEGNIGTSTMSFTVTRTQTVGAASVDVASSNGSASLADNDYLALPNTTLNFADGVATQIVNVTINGDNKFEANETINLNLSSPVGASIADGIGEGSIDNDDAAPSMTIADLTINEGNAGNTVFGFTLSLSNPSDQIITVNAATTDGTANAGTDYTALPSTVITFNPGQISATVNVNVSGDTAIEMSENFNLNLAGVSNASLLDALAIGTITNDDSPITVYTGPTITGSGIFTGSFVGGGFACTYELANSALIGSPIGVAPIPPSLPVAGAIFPHGMFTLRISGCTIGSTLNFTYTYPSNLPVGTVFWKYGRTIADPSLHWYAMPASIVGNTVTFNITDGGLGDDDLIANGIILDPAGPAFVLSGGAINQPIPSLSREAILMLASLMILLGCVAVNQRHIK